MAVIGITIAGVTKDVQAGSLHISMTANGRSTASFAVVSVDGSYRPAQDAEVVITENGSRIFAGLLEEPKERGVANGKGIPAIVTKVSAADFNVYAERRYVNGIIPAGSLASQLEWVRSNYFAVYGVALSGGQVAGPTLASLEFKYLRADEVLNKICTLSAEFGEPFAWVIDHDKILRAVQPSTVPAPFNLTGDPIADVIGDIEVDTSFKHYANRVIVKVPSKQIIEYTQTWTATGSNDTFTMPDGYDVVKTYGVVFYGGNNETLGPTGDADEPTWEYDLDAGTITRIDGAPSAGENVEFRSDVNYSGEGIAEDFAEIAAHGIHEHVELVEVVPEDSTPAAIAAGILAKCLTPTRTVKYKSHTAGILPAQSQSIIVSRRNLNGTAVVGDVVIRDVGRDTLERSVTAFIDGADTNLGRGFRDVYKKWAGDITGGGMAVAPVVEVGTSTPVGGGPAPPNRSVQFNNEMQFGGRETFLFYKEYATVTIGTGHTPGTMHSLLVGEDHTDEA
jgi:hypothetical protein